MSHPVRVERPDGGHIALVVIDAGRGNVLTRAVMAALEREIAALGEDRHVRALVLAAAGDHFSYGASVPEHTPGEVERMLPAFSSLVRTLSRTALPSVAAVRGRCLGGGLELALACHRIIAAQDALLGLPEVTLGVFPPVAAAVLPLRVPQPIADRLVVRGEIVDGVEAVCIGLVDDIAPAADVETRALLWAERYAALSGTAVRFATRAVRRHFDRAIEGTLAALEELYLGELMGTADAREGIAAFLEKRQPRWVDA